MHRAYRFAFIFVVALAVGSAGIGFCQEPKPSTTQQDRDLTELRETVTEQSRSLDRVTARVDAIQQTSEAAGRASEAAGRSADHVISAVETCAKIVTALISLIVVILGFLGYREITGIKRHRDEAGKAAEDAKKAAETASEYVKRMDSWVAQTEAKAREFQSIQMGTELPPETKEAFQDIGRRLDLVEALGLPLDADACLARGHAFYARGEDRRALDCFDRAIELKPDNARAHSNRSAALVRLGRLEEALIASNLAVELKPDYGHAYYNRACTHARLDKRDEALTDLRKAIDLYPACRGMAKTEEDFASLRDDPEFRELVGLDEEGPAAAVSA